MAFINNTSTNTVENPIDKYVDMKKWKFVSWNKDVSLEEEHTLDRFVILDKTYWVKGSDWSDILKKYTAKYFSNEIRDFKQKLFLVKISFWDAWSKKDLLFNDTWKSIKDKKLEGVNINMFLIVLDLNDNKVKQISFQWNNFFIISNYIKNINQWQIMWIDLLTKYTNWKSDKDWNEILVDEEFVDGLKWTEAATYKKKYIVVPFTAWEVYDGKELISLGEKLDKHYNEKNKYYATTYWVEQCVENTSNDVTLKEVDEINNLFQDKILVDWVEIPF